MIGKVVETKILQMRENPMQIGKGGRGHNRVRFETFKAAVNPHDSSAHGQSHHHQSENARIWMGIIGGGKFEWGINLG